MSAPIEFSPSRRAGSIRRTSHIDILLGTDGLVLDGGARDLVTSLDGSQVTDEAHVHAVVGPDRRLRELATTPARHATEGLLGCSVGGGFRDAIKHALPEEVSAGTALALLLDDLPVAALISGYAMLFSGGLSVRSGQAPKEDICSGWRSEGTMMESVRADQGVPVTIGPAAPSIAGDAAIDPLGWHALGDLPIGAMRRRRLIDVTDGECWQINAMFRDTHVDADGSETVLHEYSLIAEVDRETGRFTECSAIPRVLPWVECPVAAASAWRLAGHHVNDVRQFVRADLRGTSTCTHLNDLLRSLGDVNTLTTTLIAR